MSKGLKFDNKASSVPVPSKPNTELLEKAAVEATTRMTEFKQRSWDLGTAFKSMIEDRILVENKSVMAKDLEQETINKLSALATELNADLAQPDGVGSTALCVLLMKMLLVQRDRLNSQAYYLNELEKRLAKIENKS